MNTDKNKSRQIKIQLKKKVETDPARSMQGQDGTFTNCRMNDLAASQMIFVGRGFSRDIQRPEKQGL